MRMMTFNRSPLESNLDSKVKEYLKDTYKKEAWFLKVHGNGVQRSGIPDFLICVRGHFMAIETKREDGTGKPSDQQLIECRKLLLAGARTLISDDFEEIKKFIESVVKYEDL